ncbi:membrane progestin receptor alpha-B-like [Solea senegalensis]|uniref:Membrane progestin receptor alpha-B-like n=2 Tax=Solea senegalensis TaxID=28829 RepID=A0AAV6R624_SOLSE|nr:membrane progestin receptor alpha-B-like [Solea senegalensis]
MAFQLQRETTRIILSCAYESEEVEDSQTRTPEDDEGTIQLSAVMATIVMERLGHVFISLQQIRQVPRMLTEASPSMPDTVRDTEVPPYFREHHVCTGYRQLDQSWRYYILSLFQRHNETINIWTHLVAFLVFLVKMQQLVETVDFVGDPHSWPLLILMLSSLIYTGFSVTAHMMGGKSELCHYIFYFLDYVGVAQYQYGSAAVHFYYAVDQSLHGLLRGIFMPAATVLSCLSFLGCSYGKYCNLSKPTWVRKLCQVLPSSLAYMWDSSPVAKRLFSWSTAGDDPAILYHFGQVAFFLSCALFFTCPVLERCFPGRCDFVGQSHQVFHVFLSCCTLCQIHASYLDYVGRRELYSRLHESGEATVIVGLYALTLVVCALIFAVMIRKVKRVLDLKTK